MLAPFRTRHAAEAVVATVDQLAAQAGIGALRAGGCAVDAAIAAGAVLAVTQEPQCGLGGDLIALVHRPGDASPATLLAAGRAGSGADPGRLRAAGHVEMPLGGDPGCSPVPGCVDGWLALHERFGRLALADLLAPARAHAVRGFAASPALSVAAAGLAGVPHAQDFTAAGRLAPGAIVRRPGVARCLEAIGRAGRAGFYGGEFGAALIAAGGGEYTAADLAQPQAQWRESLGIDAFGRRVWCPPPSSQGYLLLRAAAIASGLQLGDPRDPAWAHRLIESARAAEADRESTWHETADGPALVAPAAIDAMRATVAARAGRGAVGPVSGGTVSLCVVDGDRLAVSLLQSNFMEWGSRRFLPGLGIVLHNRGSCFSLQAGHPAAYGPGRRPPHTLSPLVVTDPTGSLSAVIATRGGHIQPQILLQLLARLYPGAERPAQAIAAGRWSHSADGVALEGQAPDGWTDGLSARGHRVTRGPSFDDAFGHAQVIVADGGSLAAASDPRSATWAVAAL